MGDSNQKQLTVYANGFRIKGNGNILPGARVTDYINDASDFLALTDAEVWASNGRFLLAAPFMNINRNSIELAVPHG